MRHLFLSIALAASCCFSAFAQATFDYVQLYPLDPSGAAPVGLYNRVEFGVVLDAPVQNRIDQFLNGANGINPYDPEQISVEAKFTAPDGQEIIRYGFYYQNISNENSQFKQLETPYPFRVRFAPTQVGEWQVEITAVLANKTLAEQALTFRCIASDNPGFIVRGFDQTPSDRYLRYSHTGKTFFAIGENLDWADFKFSAKSRTPYLRWMEELATAGGNFMRVGMTPWSYSPEWEVLGNYHGRQNQMWELDNIFLKAEEEGLYVILHMEIHDPFRPDRWQGDPHSWRSNPYGKLESVHEPLDFFTDEEARRIYKKRLRYIISRWGYSTNLAVFELFSEVDGGLEEYNDLGTEMIRVNQWYREMQQVIHDHFGRRNRLVSASFAVEEEIAAPRKIYGEADVALIHNYGEAENQNYDIRWDLQRKVHTRYKSMNIPSLQGECGAGFGSLDACSPITFHNTMWSSALSGSAGTGMNWWWDSAIHKKGYQNEFKPIAKFFEDEDLVNFQYLSDRWRSKDLENYYIYEVGGDKIRGWVHNRSYWWPNQYNTNQCIKTLIDDNNGLKYDKSDNTPYANFRDKDAPTPIANGEMIIKNLGCRWPWKKRQYKVSFYSTSGEGGHIEGKDVTARASMFGCMKVQLPALDDANPDYAYKIERVENP